MKKISKLLTLAIGVSAIASTVPFAAVSCSNSQSKEQPKQPTVATAKLNLAKSPNEVDLQNAFTPVTMLNNSDQILKVKFRYTGDAFPEGCLGFYMRYGQNDQWISEWKLCEGYEFSIYAKMCIQIICLWEPEYVGNFSNQNAKFQFIIEGIEDEVITVGGSLMSLVATQDEGVYKGATELKSEYTFSELFALNKNVKFNVSSNLLPFKKLTAHCYDSMFKDCAELLTAPALPAETLADSCYKDMFNGCTKLKSSGNLPAILLADNCYKNMFYNCENLNLISLAYVGNFSEKYFKDWVKGAGTKSISGIIRYNGLDTNEKSNFGIPTNFKVIQDQTLISNHTKVLEIQDDGYSSVISGTKPKLRLYSDQGLKFGQIKDQITTYEAKVAGTPFKAWLKGDKVSEITLTDDTEVAALPNIIVPSYGEDESKRVFAKHCTLVVDETSTVKLIENNTDQSKSNIQYLESKDGETWDETKWTKMKPGTPYSWKKGYSYALKGNSQTTDPLHSYTQIQISNGKVRLGGNVMSLALVDGKIPEDPTTLTKKACFSKMFAGSDAIYTVDDNFLPATNLTEFCYASMFNGCTNLTKAPRLPATKAAGACYHWMFAGCTKLQTIPQIALEELVDAVLPIEVVGVSQVLTGNGVCDHMFAGCTSLVNVPDLKPKKLTDRAYNYMFSGCTSLTNLPKIYATEFTDGKYYNEYGFPDGYGYSDIGGSCNGMFNGCTSLEDASNIWANETKTCPESKSGCFRQMFNGCKKLIKAPVLSNTLSKYCYYQMFINCTKLQVYSGTPSQSLGLTSYKLFTADSTLPDYATTGMFSGTAGGYKNSSTSSQVTASKSYYCGYKQS